MSFEPTDAMTDPHESMEQPYVCRVLQTVDDIDSIVPAWCRLLDSGSLGSNFHNDPQLIAASAKLDTSVLPLVVMVERSGTLVAVAPFFIYTNLFRLRFSVFALSSLKIRMLKLAGNTVVLDKNVSASDCLKAVFQAVNAQADRFDLLFLDGITSEEALWRYVQRADFRREGMRVFPAASAPDLGFQLSLPSTYEEYFQSLGTNTRKSLKKRTHDLCERNQGVLSRVTQSAEVESFLRQVDEIYRDSWQAKTYGGRVRCIPGEISRLREIAELGWLRSYVLRRSEKPVAFQLGYQYRGVFYAMDFAFAQAEADRSPGAVLMHLMFQDLYAWDSPRQVDLGHGDSPQKHTFRAVPYEVQFAYIVPRKRRAWFIRVQQTLTNVERWIRSGLVRWKVDRAVRRILKHKS
jgi:CelD/BcsL family acetyltransferase involved in cellulose biosynthesis